MCFQADSPWASCRRSVILFRTEQMGCSSVDRADGPRPTRGQSARPRQTVRGALADGPPGQTASPSRRLIRVFTVGIQTWTVREGITDSSRGTRFAHNG
jgi:hypothetical protein